MAWFPRRCVLVPIDFSESSFDALDTALEMVADPSHVYAVHVMPALNDPAAIWNLMDIDERRALAERKLKERLVADNHPQVVSVVRTGDAGEAITEYAADIHAELIVLPSHQRRGLNRLLMGSVAERVARLAPCPVLILRRTEEPAE
jgi:nucleotide-binding universal stress UspA family protein